MEYSQFIHTAFKGEYAEFFEELDIPVRHGFSISRPDTTQCGRHIANYLAYNAEEADLFRAGLRRWSENTDGTFPDQSDYCSPYECARWEAHLNEKAEIHLAAYRAIEALMTNNPTLKCFHGIDLGKIIEYRKMLEMPAPIRSSSATAT